MNIPEDYGDLETIIESFIQQEIKKQVLDDFYGILMQDYLEVDVQEVLEGLRAKEPEGGRNIPTVVAYLFQQLVQDGDISISTALIIENKNGDQFEEHVFETKHISAEELSISITQGETAKTEQEYDRTVHIRIDINNRTNE
jgi:hypothetical protein